MSRLHDPEFNDFVDESKLTKAIKIAAAVVLGTIAFLAIIADIILGR